jgi:hypothetical protein
MSEIGLTKRNAGARGGEDRKKYAVSFLRAQVGQEMRPVYSGRYVTKFRARSSSSRQSLEAVLVDVK